MPPFRRHKQQHHRRPNHSPSQEKTLTETIEALCHYRYRHEKDFICKFANLISKDSQSKVSAAVIHNVL